MLAPIEAANFLFIAWAATLDSCVANAMLCSGATDTAAESNFRPIPRRCASGTTATTYTNSGACRSESEARTNPTGTRSISAMKMVSSEIVVEFFLSPNGVIGAQASWMSRIR